MFPAHGGAVGAGDHQPHGQLVGDATEPGLPSYTVWITCPCGVEFRRLMTDVDAALDLAELARLT